MSPGLASSIQVLSLFTVTKGNRAREHLFGLKVLKRLFLKLERWSKLQFGAATREINVLF